MSEEKKTLEKYNYCASKGGQYIYARVLGRGNFGIVLKALDTKREEFVAVKIMAYKGIIIKDSTQQKKEVNILSCLNHENIVKIKDNFEYKEWWFRVTGIAIVMELCTKGSLSEVLKGTIRKNQAISEEKRFTWYIQLMSALVHIHSKHIAHRDIKPENILVDAKGGLKIGDVGISKVLYTEESLFECSSSVYMKTLAGTYPFMAPEVFRNHYTEKSDIFSMGLVMFTICERPNHLIPIVKEDMIVENLRTFLRLNYLPLPGLGLFYYCGGEAMATDAMLTSTSLNMEEKDIFNDMLLPKYRHRSNSTQILSKLREIVRRREEEKKRKQRKIQSHNTISPKETNGGWCSAIMKLLLLVFGITLCIVLFQSVRYKLR